MSADFRRRFLRPRYVFSAGGHIWVVDDTQPVAALFDPGTEQLVRLVSWTDLPPPPAGSRPPTIEADADGLWVQNHRDGPLARVCVDGIVRGEYLEDHQLICAGPAGAWCARFPRRRADIASAPDVPPRRPIRRPTLLVALPEGGTRRVVVDAAAMVSVDFDESSLFVSVEHDPWERIPVAREAGAGRDGFAVRYRSSVLQVPLGGPVPDRIGPDTTPHARGHRAGHTSEYADQTYNEDHRRKRAVDAELRWHWGIEPAGSGDTIVRAYRSEAPRPVVEIDLPGARVAHGAAAAGRLWMVTTSNTSTDRSFLVADTGGRLHPVPVDGIDISDLCWPVGPEPLDHDAYVAYCVRGLDGLRFSDEVDQVSAAYVGGWPDGRVHVSFRHVDYPGLTLVARLSLYDERGARLDRFLGYVRPLLLEQAGTRAYPPASDAADGVLYV